MTIGKRIQTLRENRTMTKADLAERVGVSDVAVGYWETGETKQIGHKHIIALCRTFGCTADKLLGLDEKE